MLPQSSDDSDKIEEPLGRILDITLIVCAILALVFACAFPFMYLKIR